MDRDKLTAALRPLALAFAGELADVLHKHMSARVDAVRKSAVEQLRADLEDKPDGKQQRPRDRSRPGRALPEKDGRQRKRLRVRRQRAAADKVDRTRAVPRTTRRQQACSKCGATDHNARRCSKAKAEVAPARVKQPTLESNVKSGKISAETSVARHGSEATSAVSPSAARRELIAQRDLKPANVPVAKPQPKAPPPTKLDRFARIEERARARVGVDGLPIPASSFEF